MTEERYRRFASLAIDRVDTHILCISFNRPEQRNSLSAENHRDLSEVWQEVHADSSVRAVILRGEGRHFSAGGDFSVVEQMIDNTEFRQRVWAEARDLVYNIVNCNKPIVSAMQGNVVGGGLAAGLLADITIAAKDAILVDGHVRLGVCAGDHAVMLWPLLCSLAKAKYHLLLNEPISGAEAERIGLVSLAVDAQDLESTALSVARRLAAGSPSAISLTKRALNAWLLQAGPAFEASLAFEMMGFTGPDAQEGLQSFREKRAPQFTSKV